MSLSSLPPELKLHIVEYLDPVPTLHFALTSKDHSNLSYNYLWEHILFSKCAAIQTTYDRTMIWDLTKKVLLDPRKGWYVREINLTASRPHVHAALSEEDKLLFKAAAKKLLPLYPYEPGFFATEDDDVRELGAALDDSITRGSEDAILVILIHHLPQLRILRMADVSEDVCFSTFMRRVAAGYQNPAQASQMPLQLLNTAIISHSDTMFCCDIFWAVYFLCIPSLRTFVAHTMGSEGVRDFVDSEDSEDEPGIEAHLRNTAGAPVSNVEELLFKNCQFDPQSFNTILPMIKNLKKFRYLAGGYQVAYQDYEPRRVIKALTDHASHSLEELELAECTIGFEDGERDIPFVSARDFKKLKALHCELCWLLPVPNDDVYDDEALSQGFRAAEEEPDDMRDPRDNLPASLEYLYLDGVYEWGEWDKMVEIFKTANPNTPKLTLANSCINDRGETSYGDAVRPELRFAIEHLEQMRDDQLY